ncbi:MAG: hypothetical protein LPH21_12590 [Shewanella sp.]|nr:hypothetical protein [Shewanella sp.]
MNGKVVDHGELNVPHTMGIMEGRLDGIHDITENNASKIQTHEQRLRFIERIVFGLAGVFVFVQFAPHLVDFVGQNV